MPKRTLSALLTLCMALTLLPPPFAKAAKTPFSDVADTAYYVDAVVWAVNQGITNGTTATTFSPDNTCTTAQILTFLWRAYGKPEPSITNPFTDVLPDNYYYKAALWARQNGIAQSSAFNPNTLCSRINAVYYMWMLNGQPVVGSHAFTDVPKNRDNAVAWAVNYGITSGTSETTFSPDNTCTRAHIVTFLYRANQKGQLGAGSVEIDGIRLSEAKQIQSNMYYYSESMDYAELERNNFPEIVKTVYAELVSIFNYDPLRELNKSLLIKVVEDNIQGNNFAENGCLIVMGMPESERIYFSARTVKLLGHEMTHLFLCDNLPHDYWNEEIIADSMGMYMVSRLNGRVSDPTDSYARYLSFVDTWFPRDDSNMHYNRNPEPISLDGFAEYANAPGNKSSEVRWAYELLLQTPDAQIRQLRDLHRYYKATQPTGYIDYGTWIQNAADQGAADFIRNLSKIQPRLSV